MALKQVMFEEASTTADWRFPYRIIVPKQAAWDMAIEEVVLGMTPDFVTWDDYGHHSRSFPDGASSSVPPWYQASSDDDDGVVMLVDPNLVDIVVPWNSMRTMGPGGVNVSVQYRQKVTGSRSTLLVGRLPLLDGVI